MQSHSLTYSWVSLSSPQSPHAYMGDDTVGSSRLSLYLSTLGVACRYMRDACAYTHRLTCERPEIDIHVFFNYLPTYF